MDGAPVARSTAITPASVLLTVPSPLQQQAEYRPLSISPNAGTLLRLKQRRPAQLYSMGTDVSSGYLVTKDLRCSAAMRVTRASVTCMAGSYVKRVRTTMRLFP